VTSYLQSSRSVSSKFYMVTADHWSTESPALALVTLTAVLIVSLLLTQHHAPCNFLLAVCMYLCHCVCVMRTLWFAVAAPVAGVTSSDELVSLSTPEISLPVSTLRPCWLRSVLIVNIELCNWPSDMCSNKSQMHMIVQMFMTSLKVGTSHLCVCD